MTRRNDHSFGMDPGKRRKRKREDDIISSEGVQKDVHEDTHISTTEGAVLLKPTTDGFLKANAPSLQQDASKDLMRMSRSIRARKTKAKNKSGLKQKVNKRTSVLDVTDESTHRYSKRVRKQAKARSALLSLHNLAESLHKNKETRMGITTEKIFAHHATINMVDGEYNDTHPLAFAAGGLGPNPNILNHSEAMAAVDKVNFEESMTEEMEKCFDNSIYEIVNFHQYQS